MVSKTKKALDNLTIQVKEFKYEYPTFDDIEYLNAKIDYLEENLIKVMNMLSI